MGGELAGAAIGRGLAVTTGPAAPDGSRQGKPAEGQQVAEASLEWPVVALCGEGGNQQVPWVTAGEKAQTPQK